MGVDNSLLYPPILVVPNHDIDTRVELLPIIYRFTGKLFLPFYWYIMLGKNGKMVNLKLTDF
jgi:hypothetical protein